MNKQLFLDLADILDESPEAFNMNHHAGKLDPDKSLGITPYVLVEDFSLTNCGTAACICGWTNFMIRPEEDVLGHFVVYKDEIAASKALEITAPQSVRLFYCGANSIWTEVASEFGWGTYDGGIKDWNEIKAWQAAIVLRRITNGELEL